MNELTISWDSGPETYTIHPLQYPTYQTIPKLKGISEIERALNLDFSFENSVLKFSLYNQDGYFTQKCQQEDPMGKDVVLKDSGETVFTGRICSFPTETPDSFSMKADIFSLLKSPVSKEITSETFPEVPAQNEGWGNIVIGNANIVPGMLKARRAAANRYHASWGNCSDLFDFQNKNGGSIQPTGFGYDSEKGYSYINYTSSDDWIRFSALGPEDTGALIENPAYMLSELASEYSQLETEGIEEAAAVFEERNYNGNVIWIDDNMDWKRLLQTFSKNFNCRAFLTRSGKLKVKVLRWGMETPVLKIHPSEIKAFRPGVESSQIKGKWQRKYQYNPVEKEYIRTPVDIEGNTNVDEVGEFLQKFLVKGDTSRDGSLREAFFLKNKIYIYTFSIPVQRANQLDLGDTVQVKHRKSFFKNEYRQVQLLRERRVPGSGFVEFNAFDMSEINKKTFILQAAGHPEVAVLGENDSPSLW